MEPEYLASRYPKIPLGRVVAERHFVLWDSEGREREIVVKLGTPVQIETGLFRCPAQILGLGVDQIVYDPAGEDAFIALCYALDLIGQVLEAASKSLNLQNRYKTGEKRSPAWVWQCMDQPSEQT
jgi:hypothetical protein